MVCELAKTYADWLSASVVADKIDDGCIITLPFYNQANDNLQLIILPQKDGRILVTDDGATIGDVMEIPEIYSESRATIVKRIVNQNSLSIQDNEISDMLIKIPFRFESMKLSKHCSRFLTHYISIKIMSVLI